MEINTTNLWEERPDLKLAAAVRRTFQSQGTKRWHEHPFLEVGLVLEGEGDWLFGKKNCVTVKAGEVILVRSNVLHCEVVREGNHLDTAWIGFETPAPPPSWAGRAVPMGEDFEEVRRIFETIYEEQREGSVRSRLRLNLLVQMALLLMTRQAEKEEIEEKPSPVSLLNARQIGCVEGAAHYFKQNIESSLKIAQVAAYYSMCPSYFSTLFQRHFGISPQAFLIQARLERGADLLGTTLLTVKEIAARCGYVDTAHFCKEFKQRRGITPGAYRAWRGEERRFG